MVAWSTNSEKEVVSDCEVAEEEVEEVAVVEEVVDSVSL